MKKILLILLFIGLNQVHAQDSLSTAFLNLLNKYRIENNLHPLIYDASLDSVAMVRLVESSQGIDDCFDEKPDLNVLYKCKDGLRNMHFKFDKTMKSFNKMNNDIQIISENMVLMAQFKKRIPSNNFAFNNLFFNIKYIHNFSSRFYASNICIGTIQHMLNRCHFIIVCYFTHIN